MAMLLWWFIFLVVLGFELRPSQVFYYLSHSPSPFFVLVILKTGSRELFAQADFEP
jgi:hypothetical protein